MAQAGVPAIGTASGTRHRTDIQGLRAVAVLLVVAFHAHLGFSGGFVGVDVFFVISGFVITGMLLPELDLTGRLDLTRFYARRLRRLVPALGLVVVATALLGVLAAPIGIQQTASHTGGAASVFLGNVYLYLVPKGYFAASSDLNPFLHTWSLAVEEQFYLVFPLTLVVAWRIGARRRSMRRVAVAILATGGVVSFVLALAMVRGHAIFPGISSPSDFAFYSSPTRAWEFAAGALLAFATTRLGTVSDRIAVVTGSAGFVVVLAVALRYDQQTLFPGTAAIAPVLGTVLILGAGIGGTRGIGRMLSLRPLVFLGDISYSWYLWHWPAIVYAKAMWPGSFSAPTAAVLSIVPAWISYRFVENPIRLNPRLNPRRTVSLAVGAIALALVACLVLDVSSRQLKQTKAARNVASVSANHKECPKTASARAGTASQGTNGDEATGSLDGRRCTWPVAAPRATVALAGDSNARHFVEGLVRATHDQRDALFVATANACPFADVTMVVLGKRRADCRRFFLASLAAIERLRPSVVIIGSSTNRYVAESQFGLVVGDSGPTAKSEAAKLAAWSAGLRRLATRLDRDGINTIVVHPIPKFPGWDIRGCAAVRVVAWEFSCGRTASRASEDASGAPCCDPTTRRSPA